MKDAERLTKLLRSETYLKQTKVGYSPTAPNWKRGMPLLWEVRQSFPPGDWRGLDLATAHGTLKETLKGYDPKAPKWRVATKLIDGVEEDLHRSKVPALGPVLLGDKSLLLWVPTHKTDGLHEVTGSWYPAFDSGFGKTGKMIIAPESLIVTRQSSAQGADAFYATGESGLEYWFGHLVTAPRTGVRLAKGDKMGVIAPIAASDGGPHFHCGVNAKPLIGRDLKWGRTGSGPDYTFGSPTYGQQLAAALET